MQITLVYGSASSPNCPSKRSSTGLYGGTTKLILTEQQLVETTEWDLIIPQECCDVDAYWVAWKNYFMQVMQMCVPRATVKVKTSVPWMNQAIRKAMKKRDSLSRVTKCSSDPTHWSKYKHQRNYVVKLLRKSRQDFVQQLNTRDAKLFGKP